LVEHIVLFRWPEEAIQEAIDSAVGVTARHKRTAVPRYGDVPRLLKVVAKNHYFVMFRLLRKFIILRRRSKENRRSAGFQRRSYGNYKNRKSRTGRPEEAAAVADRYMEEVLQVLPR